MLWHRSGACPRSGPETEAHTVPTPLAAAAGREGTGRAPGRLWASAQELGPPLVTTVSKRVAEQDRAGDCLSVHKDPKPCPQLSSLSFWNVFWKSSDNLCVIYLFPGTAQGPAFHSIGYFDMFTRSSVCLGSIRMKTSNFKLMCRDRDFLPAAERSLKRALLSQAFSYI